MKAATQIIAALPLAARTAASLEQYHPEVPREKLMLMVGRTLVGTLLALVGLAVLLAFVGVPVYLAVVKQDAGQISLTLAVLGLAFGLGLVVAGAITASGQLLLKPLSSTLALFKGIYQTVRPPKVGP